MKNNAEEKKKLSIGFNLVDLVIILFAVLCIVGVWQRNNLQQIFGSGEDLSEYTVTFEVKKMRSTTADLLAKDVELYLEENGTKVSLGTLAEQVSTSAAVVYLQNEKGETVKAVYPYDSHEYLLDVSGILSCRGVEHDGMFLLQGKTQLTVNQTLAVYTETADFEIRITGIQKKA